jgi:hypothetical protein
VGGNEPRSSDRIRKDSMEFYNLKTRTKVDVPDSDVRKTKMVRKTKNGEQTRYALKATYQGSTLYKFVNEATYNATNVAEV